MTWSQQKGAVVTPLMLTDGRWGKVVIVGSRDNPKGAVLVVAARDGEPVRTFSLDSLLDSLTPQQVVEILCMQERVYGSSGLDAPPLA